MTLFNDTTTIAAQSRPSSAKTSRVMAAEEAIRLPHTTCPIKPQVSLANLTSWRVGGPADWYAAPRVAEDLPLLVAWAADRLPMTLLGAGTNLLISDRGLPGLVICTRHLRHTQFDEATGTLTAGAGEPIARLAWQAAERGWSGLEWAVGIPGTVGGAVVMNAGAHHADTAGILIDAQVLAKGKVETVTPDQLGYRYRSSILQSDGRLVTQARFQLQPGHDPQQILATTTAHRSQRLATQPYNLPSCGSVFRNPSPRTAGWLIEQTGLKGYQIGGAQVAKRHANFILNCGGATATDILQLIRYVQQQVEANWSLWLEPEVKMLGFSA